MNRFLPDKTIQVHSALANWDIPHAFGGAIALAFYGEPRVTRDLDINIALAPTQHGRVFDCLAALFSVIDREKAEREVTLLAQTRVMWEHTPLDLFFADIPFHDSIARRTHVVDYVGTQLPIVSAEDLVVLKACFNRPKDWLDIEAMFAVLRLQLDASYIRLWLSEFYQPPDDVPVQRVEDLIRAYQATDS